MAVSQLGASLDLCGEAVVLRAIAFQLSTDRRGAAIQGPGDLLLICTSIRQLRYVITLLHCKMTCLR